MLLHCFDKVTVMVFSKGLPNGEWDIIIACCADFWKNIVHYLINPFSKSLICF